MKIRWELTIDAVTTEVQPVNAPELALEPADDELFKFYMRPKISELTFKGSDYQLLLDKLNDASPCDDIILDVTRECSSGDDWTFQFKFSVHDAEWNEDRCQVSVKPTPNDLYECIKANWDQQINLFDNCNRWTTKYRHTAGLLNPGGIYAVSQFDDFPSILDWQLTDDSTDLTVTDPTGGWFTSRRLTITGATGDYWFWIRDIMIFDCVDGALPSDFTTVFTSGYNILSNDCATKGTITIVMTKFVLLGLQDLSLIGIGDYNITTGDFTEYATPQAVPPSDPAIFVGEIYTGYELYWDVSIGDIYRADTTFYNGVLLIDVANEQAGNVCADLTGIKSDFFQINPDNIDTENYVTGTYNWWNAENLFMFQITDVSTPSSAQSNQATRMESTFKSFLEMLRDMFQVYPSFDGTELIIEHESYYQNAVIFDLSSKTGRNNYKFNLDEVFHRYDYKWLSSFNLDFKGLPMLYGPSCTNRGQKDISVNGVTTDIMHVYQNDTFSGASGIVFMNAFYDGGNRYIFHQYGQLSNVWQPNTSLGWANLHYNFHRHNRPLITGTMNAESVNHQSALRIKEQVITSKHCCGDLIESGLVTTELGDGQIKSMKINTLTDTVEFVLLHEQTLTT